MGRWTHGQHAAIYFGIYFHFQVITNSIDTRS